MIELHPGQPALSDEDLNRLIRQQGLGWPLARALVLEQVVRSVALEPEACEALVETYLAQHQIQDPEARQRFLAAEGISEEDLLWRATSPHRLDVHCQRIHGPDVESHYLDRKQELDQVIYSLIRVGDADLAAELHQQIHDGEADFAQLAPLHSLGPERASRGVVGPVPLSAAHPELLERLRSCEPGQLLEPFFVVNVWLLVRLEQRLNAPLDDDLRRQLERELFDRWLQEQVRAILSGERQSGSPDLPASLAP